MKEKEEVKRRKEAGRTDEGDMFDMNLPGILRFRSQVLPTVAMEGAWRFLVMLSFMRPSPKIFTVNGLPVHTQTSRKLTGKRAFSI